jgi:ribosomal protein S18 acetylase RimI-like enzyme
MADETVSDKLKGMAEHRGLKLLKSRKRKVGTGDYGKFGLTDLNGKPLLGVGNEGLTASPEDIENYLRQGATSTWKASAENTPARSASIAREAAPEAEEASVIRPRRRQDPFKAKRQGKSSPSTVEVLPPSPKKATERQEGSDPAEPVRRVKKAPAPAPKPAPEPEPELELAVRAAKSADAAALVPLLSQLAHIEIDELAVARNLDAVRKAKGGMAVAELGELVGFCSWAVLATVQHGVVGRISLLLVDEDYRRRGIATQLLETAMAALRNAGCTRVEAMSDIEIANAHGFFRTLKFEQTSYRFARAIDFPK